MGVTEKLSWEIKVDKRNVSSTPTWDPSLTQSQTLIWPEIGSSVEIRAALHFQASTKQVSPER